MSWHTITHARRSSCLSSLMTSIQRQPVCLRLWEAGNSWNRNTTYSEHNCSHRMPYYLVGEIFFSSIWLKEALVRIYRRSGIKRQQNFFSIVLLSYALLFEPPYPIYVEVGIVLVECWSDTKVAPPSRATCLRNFLEQAPLHPCSLLRDEWR
jgi:hypothetical protein